MGVLDLLFLNPGIFWKMDFGIGAFQPRMFEDAHFEIARLLSSIFHMVSEIARHFRNAAAEDRVIEILDQRQTAVVAWPGFHDQFGPGRKGAGKSRQHNKGAASLDAGIAWSDGDVLPGFGESGRL